MDRQGRDRQTEERIGLGIASNALRIARDWSTAAYDWMGAPRIGIGTAMAVIGNDWIGLVYWMGQVWSGKDHIGMANQ